MKKTIPYLFQGSVKKHSTRFFLWEKTNDHFEGSTFEEVARQVSDLSSALHQYGIRKGDRITLLSEGRNDWVIAEMSIFHLGAINVPLSIKIIEASEIKFRINHSESKLVFVSGNQLAKIRAIKNELITVESFIIMDTPEHLEAKEVLLKDFIAQGSGHFENNNIHFDNLWQDVDEHDCATISYTSGTTAEPKGIMLSHRNYTANVEQAEGLFSIPSDYKTLLILPWDHSFAHTVGIFPLMKNGAALASVQTGKTANETLRNIPVNIKEIQPNFLLSVPALARNFKNNIERNIKAKGPFTEKLFNFALKNAYQYHKMGHNRGKGLSLLRKPLNTLFKKILFSKIKEGFGGQLEFFVGGGALLDLELQRFFCAVDMPMYQGYGLTEAAPIISSNTPDAHKFGSSGKIAPNLECKILNEDGKELETGQKGEIVIKGENVMLGYWKNEEATAETIRDGWLYTGDLGYLDPDGYLYVLGRYKSLLISQDGEKYSPEGIEEAITDQSPFIDQIMLHNDHDPYTVGLVVPNIERLKQTLKTEKPESKPEKCLELLKKEIAKYQNEGIYGSMFPERWLPSTFSVVPESFNEQNGLMNSTMKIVRGKITKRFETQIRFMYSPEGKNILNENNLRVLEKLLG